ncbi:hypothetical protein [Hymenobacter nivis]|uniref:Uncharacterized protein n=1 Tax=Hymenobacter nivis TaxID=1850093 RepID=A0A2Z3GJH2_9BACT|nr:hypothetical protein [Hymenobacter nivis]AWM32142.1 hypothetical protein DDQ68_04625 [Hymenobacter nivis]
MSRYGMSVSALAAKIGVDKNVLINKLHPARYNKLTDHEQQQIFAVFQQLQQELAAFLETDLDELPAALANQATAPRDAVREMVPADVSVLKIQQSDVVASTPIAQVLTIRAGTKGVAPEQQPLVGVRAANLQTVADPLAALENVLIATEPTSTSKPVTVAKTKLQKRIAELLLGYEGANKPAE